ncbi:hypothetical protein [Thiocapsa roseopersicina]|uniref:Uncharacterized protein n=1 Tax=Thiocapsa roseopersicina TaxID=1058 RepID=A0A1H2X416_THIRO|nr:hypothetical protein [Thiocapsa roseopersicina]SDW87527.1 hypothetical protein SAMN05421783_1103 [Thiocapsa roseopersicina]
MSTRRKNEQIDPDAMWEARALLEAAGRIMQRIESGQYPADRIDAVAWRIADALLSSGQADAAWVTLATPRPRAASWRAY